MLQSLSLEWPLELEEQEESASAFMSAFNVAAACWHMCEWDRESIILSEIQPRYIVQ